MSISFLHPVHAVFLLLFSSVFMMGCETASTAKTATPRGQTLYNDRPPLDPRRYSKPSDPQGVIRSPSGEVLVGPVRKQTAAEKKAAQAATSHYYAALRKKVVQLDDGASGADAVGRAALALVMAELRNKVRLQTIHLGNTDFEKQMLRKSLAELPTADDYSQATAMVLSVRRGS